METNIERHIDNLIKNGREVKAGIWQATELFQDDLMLVINNADIELMVPDDLPGMLELTKADMPWCQVHFNERVSGKPLNPGESYKIWPYNTFKAENDPFLKGKKFSHTYMERFWPRQAALLNDAHDDYGIRFRFGDLNDVIKQLADNPLTRQAYLPIFFPEDTGAVHGERVPCTLGYLFYINDGILHCNYYIRSCDALRHFRNDIYLTMRLMHYIMYELECTVGLGKLTMYIANFHIFKNDLYALNKKENKLRNHEQDK